MDVEYIKSRLSSMGIAEKKQHELFKNPKMLERLNIILKNSYSNNKLLLVQSQYTSDEKVTRAIESGLAQNERSLKFAIEQNMEYDELESFIREQVKTDDEVRVAAQNVSGNLKDIMKTFSDRFKFNDLRRVVEIVQEVVRNRPAHGVCEAFKAKKDWMDGGVVAKLHRPGETSQVEDSIRDLHLKHTGGAVVTRFPPEPNGVLHIGHAKALNLNFQYAQKHNGYVFMRFDDTDPKGEKLNYYKAIIEDVEWLGFKPKFVTASSDYFERMIEFGKALIMCGKAYVCHLSPDEIRKYRREDGAIHCGVRKQPAAEILRKYVRSGTKHPECKCPSRCEVHARAASIFPETGKSIEHSFKLSPFRNRPVDVNLALFQEMIDGKWKEGTAVLRMKMDADSSNPFMLDLVAFRIIQVPHPLTKTCYKIYPSYDFALCICDSLEDVTHSFCSREFLTRQESYKWLLRNLRLYMPVQWEFSRLNIPNTVLSKRKIKKLIEEGMIRSIDDPRLFTIRGLRRRGVTPHAINKFCEKIGVTFSDSSIDVKMLESFVRDDLNAVAKRVMCVTNPIYAIFVCDECACNTAAAVEDKALVEKVVGRIGRCVDRKMQEFKRKTISDTVPFVEDKTREEKLNNQDKELYGLLRRTKLHVKRTTGIADDDVKERVAHLLMLRNVLYRLGKCMREKAYDTESSILNVDLYGDLFGCGCSNAVQAASEQSQSGLIDGVVFDKILCIDGDDFSRYPEKNFMRLSPTHPVGLFGLFPIMVAKEVDGVLIVKRSCEKPKKYIQWVSHPISAELRMYSSLLDAQGKINPDSLRLVEGYCDTRVNGALRYDKFQFIRMGYFCVDKDSRRKRLVFNLTTNLKNVN